MKMRRYIGALCAALLTAACADDADLLPSAPEEEEPLPAGVVEVPVTLTLGADWELDSPQTKDVPPGMETTIDVDGHAETDEINTVRVITFRRRSLDDIIVTEETDTSFIYDPSNDLTLACNWDSSSLTDHAHQHKVARGTLKKTYGYEYRVVALAYSTSRTFADTEGVCPASGEQNVFDFNLSDGLKFQDFKATVKTKDVWEEFLTGGGIVSHKAANLTQKIVFVPQFFYGYCHTGGGNPVIPYAEDGEQLDGNGDPEQVTDKRLTGLLYRGVAKVEVEMTADVRSILSVSRWPEWVALLATNMQTEVGLTDYDDFLSPASPVVEEEKYTMIDREVSLCANNENQSFIMTAYVLPTKARLAIRCRYGNGNDLVFLPEGSRMYNGKIRVKPVSDGESSAENATGIISTDVAGDDLFYFRRNHKYVFTGGYTSGITQNNPLD